MPIRPRQALRQAILSACLPNRARELDDADRLPQRHAFRDPFGLLTMQTGKKSAGPLDPAGSDE